MCDFSKFYFDLGISLLNLAINYEVGKTSLDEINSRFEKFPKLNKNSFGSPVIVFEGERCSGKDTIISKLSKQENMQNVCILNRVVDNPAWKELNRRKENCYFKMKDAIMSIMLWLSDLNFRLSSWLPITYNADFCFANRYVLSLIFCILSTYENLLVNEEKKLMYYLLQKGTCVFPDALKTIILDVNMDTIKYRMKKRKNQEFDEFELKTAYLNLKKFNGCRNIGYYHVDANQDIDIVLKEVIKILSL